MERTAGIEPAALAWKAKVLPLYDVRTVQSGTLALLDLNRTYYILLTN